MADALSRKAETLLLLTSSSPVPTLISQLQQFYASVTEGTELAKRHLEENNEAQHYKFSKGLLYYKDRLFISAHQDLRQALLKEYHDTPASGHSGTQPTIARIAASFYWPGLHSDVKNYVKHCTVCQHNKYQTQKKLGLLQPLAIPSKVWDELTMDFITHLPSSFGHTVIWVICDRLTKFVHFIALPPKFTAEDLATRFSVEICRLHGIPSSIVSDRDPLFLSTFWKELFRVQGTTMKYSTAYHPETDGQTEVVNRTLEAYLRCFVSDHPRRWYKFLHLAEFWHNTTVHSAIQMSPFKALYGRNPPSLSDYIPGSASVPSLDLSLQNRQEILQLLKNNLTKSRKQMEEQAIKKRRDFTFSVGDLVLLKLQPYRQQTVVRRSSQKLSKRYFGPFKVLRKIGQVAYELDLPSSSRIHPVVHVSLLRPYHGDDPIKHFTPLPNPDQPNTGNMISEPAEIYGQGENTQDHSRPLEANNVLVTKDLSTSPSTITFQCPSTSHSSLPLDPTNFFPKSLSGPSIQDIGKQLDHTSPPVHTSPLPRATHDPQSSQSSRSNHSLPPGELNLEDKVPFGADGNDSNQIHKRRTSKRESKTPGWLKSFY